MSRLTVVPRVGAAAASEAYRHVVAGFDAALTVEGLASDDRGSLVRCRALALDNVTPRLFVVAGTDA